jgi:hypothetical protein
MRNEDPLAVIDASPAGFPAARLVVKEEAMKTLPASGWAPRTLGRAPYVLSMALVADTAVACLASLLFRSLLRGEESGIGSLQGTALIMLIVGLPVLLGSMLLTARGSSYGPVGWLGALGFVFYQAVLFLFATPFNALFFTYAAMLSLSVWSIVVLLARLSVPDLAAHVSPRMPVRALAAYLLVNAAMFADEHITMPISVGISRSDHSAQPGAACQACAQRGGVGRDRSALARSVPGSNMTIVLPKGPQGGASGSPPQ